MEKGTAEELKEINEIRQYWHCTLDAISDVVFIIDINFRIEEINSKGCEILNKSKKHIIGKTCHEVFQCLKKSFENCPFCKSIKTKNTEISHIANLIAGANYEAKSSPIFDDQGNLIKSVIVLHEITDFQVITKPSSNHLSQNGKTNNGSACSKSLNFQQLEKLYKTSSEAIIIADANGKILEVNDKAHKLFCYSKDIFYQKNIQDLVSVHSKEPYLNAIRNISNDERICIEAQNVNQKGELIYSESTFIQFPFQHQNDVLLRIKDISTSKKMEETLTESKFFLNKAQSLANSGYYVFEKSSGRWSSSAHLDKIFGIDDSYNRTIEGWVNLIHPEYRKEMHDYLIHEVFEQGNFFDKEYPIIHQKTKEIRWIYGTGEIEYDPQGNLLRMFGINQDITEIIKAKNSLNESRNKLQDYFNQVPIGLYTTDAKGNVLSANPALVAMLGFESERELIEHTKYESAEEQELRARFLEEIDKKGEVKNYETRWRKKDGTFIHILENATAVYDDNGKIIKFKGSGSDITKRKEAENKLNKQSTLLTSLLESIPDLVFFKDINGKYLGCNTEFEKLVGKSQEKIIGMTDFDIFPANVAAFFKEQDEAMLNSMQPRSNEEWVTYPDGQKILLETFKAPIIDQKRDLIGLSGVSRKITARKMAEDALRESEAHYRTLIESAEDSIILMDENLNWIVYNSSAHLKIGLSKEEFQNLTYQNLIHPDDLLTVKEALEKIHHNEISSVRVRFKHKDGHYLHFAINAVLIKKEGEAPKILAISRDISEVVNAENALKESQQRFNAIFTYMKSGVAIYEAVNGGQDYKFISINKAAERITHSKSSELVNKQLFEMFPGMKNCELYPALKKVYQTGQSVYVPPFFYQDHKRSGWRENFIYKLPSGEIVAIFDDVSELKYSEIRLRESENRFKFLSGITFEGIVVHQNGIASDVNDSFSRITGFSREEVIGQNIVSLMVLNNDDRNKILENIQKDYANPYMVTITRKNGEDFIAELEAKNVEYNGEVVRIAAVRDVSNRVKAEKALQENELKLKEQNDALIKSNRKIQEINDNLVKANRDLDSFVYSVSHDLRAPITSTLGLTTLIKNSSSIDEICQFANLQEKSLTKLDNFIKDILNYSRNSRLKVLPVTIDFKMLVDAIIEDNKYAYENINIDFDLNIINTLPFKSDLLRIKIILNNLISNAIKFQNQYRDLHQVKIEIEADNRMAKIVISDNGIGIEPGHLDKIFDMFYRATDKKPGSGIGLYITKDCLEKINGSVKVNSELGKGTTFTIHLKSLQ